MEARFTLQDLADASGLSKRTIRYYIQEGLLPYARGKGPSARYTPQHVERLARIAELKRNGLGLGEIREVLRTIDLRQIRHPTESWEHVTLHDGLVVQVRDDAPESVRIFVNRIEELAERWFQSGIDDGWTLS